MTRLGRELRKGNEPAWTGWPHLILLLICFLSGSLIGFALAYFGESSSELRGYLQDYLALAAQGNLEQSFFAVFWDCLRWPAFVIFLGFTALGVLAIPALLLIRGFLLAYTTTCFVVLLGSNGLAVAAVLLAVSAFLVLPVLLVLGCESLRTACARLPGAPGGGDRRLRPEIVLPGAGLSLVAAALQWTVIPLLFSMVCTRYFI